MSTDALSQSFMGYSLSVAERVAVRNSLVKLGLSETPAPQLALWGKILAVQRDYILLTARRLSNHIKSDFYYSNDHGITFGKLPELDSLTLELCAKLRGRFSGDPATLYADPSQPIVSEEQSEESDEKDAEDPEQKAAQLRQRKVTELQRLSYIVRTIDRSTAIVPLGAYLLTPTGDIVANQNFNGLSSYDSRQLSSYQHFREQKTAETQSLSRKSAGVSNTATFLDTLQVDQPDGLWSLQLDELEKTSTIRSLLWPGFECRVEVMSRWYQGAYFGTGERNDDVLFML